MPLESPREQVRRAEELNASAEKHIAKGRLRQALDLLNEAIRIAPAYPNSFANRADVFQKLGMLPQAESDRRRVQDLLRSAGAGPAAITPASSAPESEPEAGPVREPPAKPEPPQEGPPPVIPEPQARMEADGVLAALRRGPLLAIVGIGGIVGALVAIGFIAASTLGGGGSDDDIVLDPAASLTPTVAPRTEAPDATPSPSPVEAGGGSPFTLGRVLGAWEENGLATTSQGTSEGFGGFAIAASDVRLERDGASLDVAVFVYSGPGAVDSDWNLTPGERPVPKGGRSLPVHTSVWWNQNVVVVVRTGSGDVSSDAFDAFLDMGP